MAPRSIRPGGEPCLPWRIGPEDSHRISGCAQKGPVTASPSDTTSAVCRRFVPLSPSPPDPAPAADDGWHAVCGPLAFPAGWSFCSAAAISRSALAISTVAHLEAPMPEPVSE